MISMKLMSSLRVQHGAMMVEVLVTIVILTIGLLGLAGLQARLQSSEMESYQRAQALLLLKDMSNRITTNRNAAASYLTVDPLGAGMICPNATATRMDRDVGEWCAALQGAAEISGANNNVGAMIGGRGCVERLIPGTYMVTIAWQGLVPLSSPPASVTCGAGNYTGGAGSACTGELCRRFATTIVTIADLTL